MCFVVICVCCEHLPAESFIWTLDVDILVCKEEREEKVDWRSGLAGHLITLSRNITSQANGMVPPGKQGAPLISLIVVPILKNWHRKILWLETSSYIGKTNNPFWKPVLFSTIICLFYIQSVQMNYLENSPLILLCPQRWAICNSGNWWSQYLCTMVTDGMWGSSDVSCPWAPTAAISILNGSKFSIQNQFPLMYQHVQFRSKSIWNSEIKCNWQSHTRYLSILVDHHTI